MILILTEAQDATADDMIERFKAKGVRTIRYETADFPQKVQHTIRKGAGISQDLMGINGETIDLTEVRTVWNRRPQAPSVTANMSAEDRKFAQKETELIFRGILQTLRDRFWVNPYLNSQVGEYKPYQLQLAQQVGWEIPQTLITNQPDEVREFYRQLDGNIIYKAVFPHTRLGNPQAGIPAQLIYTNRVRESHLEQLDAVAHAPCLFQEYVPKKVELRVTVVGRKTFAAEIHSQQSERSKEDWRRYDFENTPYYPHQLPAEVEAKCQRLVQEMGLVFGCIDLILTPDNRYVFLEINPNGQWGWIEELTGLPIGDNLVEMMIQGTPNYTNPPVTVKPAMAVAEA
ncbi:MAG: ATP-dependent carboxylate-amine ligase [Blastocatellia bacterium]|nr:ATP-dependent carboxylate-amine ligase [Blastocatellia bacterium]